MKGLYEILRTVLWCNVGVFLGSSIYQYYDYATHKSLYATQSASWYTRVLIRAGVAAAIAIVLLAAMWVIRRRMEEDARIDAMDSAGERDEAEPRE